MKQALGTQRTVEEIVRENDTRSPDSVGRKNTSGFKRESNVVGTTTIKAKYVDFRLRVKVTT